MEAELVVEMQPTTIPRPVQFGVRTADGKIIAIISPESVEQAWRRFSEMRDAWEAHRERLSGHTTQGT
jgi:hypothetical protein